MADGVVKVWNAGALLEGRAESAQVAEIERHSAAVRALQFNPHASSQHLLATGSADGDVCVINLEAPATPTVASPLTAGQRLDGEVTSVAWNSSVPYILATALHTGSVIVWDLKESKPWCTLRDPHRAGVSECVWNPEDGLYLITASDDDLRPVLRVSGQLGSPDPTVVHPRAVARVLPRCGWCLTPAPSLACLPACLPAAVGPAVVHVHARV